MLLIIMGTKQLPNKIKIFLAALSVLFLRFTYSIYNVINSMKIIG